MKSSERIASKNTRPGARALHVACAERAHFIVKDGVPLRVGAKDADEGRAEVSGPNLRRKEIKERIRLRDAPAPNMRP
eukprot:scaffold27680_cov33-Tisochrysis_lutea.AAC.5